MSGIQNLAQRWEDYRPTKTLVFWAAVAGVVGTLIGGFSWGGWVTGGTADKMAVNAATGARAELMAAVCLNRFTTSPDMAANLALLKSTDSWKRDDFIAKGGWVTLAGMKEPIDGAAELCAKQLLETTLPVAKISG